MRLRSTALLSAAIGASVCIIFEAWFALIDFGILLGSEAFLYSRLFLWPSSIGFLGTAAIPNWSADVFEITAILAAINVVIYVLAGLSVHGLIAMFSSARRGAKRFG